MATTVLLKDLCDLITKGTTPTSIGFDFTDDGVRFLRVQNISGGTVNFKEDTLYVDEQVHQSLKRSQILPGDVLLSIAGSIGRTGVVPDDAPPLNCNQAVAILRTSEKIHRPFLRHWLECDDAQKQMRGATVTGTIQNLSLTQIGELKIPLPPIPEQRRIATILHQAEILRAKRREALARLDELQQAMFIDMFGDLFLNSKHYPVHHLGSLCDVRDGTHESPQFLADGYPLITTKNLRNGQIDFSEVSLISEADYIAINKRSKVDEGDILMPMIGTIGNPVLVRNRTDFAIKNMALVKFLDSSPDRQFVLQFLKSDCFDKLVAKKHRGGTQKFLALGEIRSLPIPVPPKPLQAKFAAFVAEVNGQSIKLQNSIVDLDALFLSIQRRAFRGEL